MSPYGSQGLTRGSAQVIHGALVMGVIVIVVTLGAVRAIAAPPAVEGQAWLFRLVAFAALVMALIVIRVVRLRLAPHTSGRDEDAWWQRHGPLALGLWVAAEGMAILGAVLWFVSDDAVILVVVTTVSLALLIAHRPGRLIGG